MVIKKKILCLLTLLYVLLSNVILLGSISIEIRIKVYLDSKISPVYENVSLLDSFAEAFADAKEGNARIVHVLNVSKETFSYKVNEFVPDENGTYIAYKGSYYQTNDRRRYSYDSKNKRYVPDKNGSYIYLTDYPWARKDEDRYIWYGLGSFYSKKSYTVTKEKYFIAGVVTDIDLSTFFVKSITPVFSSGDTLLSAIKNASKYYLSIVNEYSPDKIDVALVFEKSFNPILRAKILAKFQEDTRYNIYDRLYLKELMDIIRTTELFGGENIELKYKPPKFILSFENYFDKVDRYKEEKYYFFSNDVNGAYINKSGFPVRVEVGNYYRYDSSQKKYVLDREKGNYIKYYKGPWEKDEYISTSSFYDYIFYQTDNVYNFYSFSVKAISTESAEVVGGKFFSDSVHTTLKNPVDRFLSERVQSATENLWESYTSIAANVQKFFQSVFPLTTAVREVNNLDVQLLSGKNIGIKPNYVFAGIENGYTTGFMRITNVGDLKSSAKIFYIVPGESVKPNTFAIETKQYPVSLNLRASYFIDDESFGIRTGYAHADIYGNYNWSLTFGILFPYKNFSSTSIDTEIPMRIEYSKFLGLQNFEFNFGGYFTVLNSTSNSSTQLQDFGIFSGFTLSTYSRNSALSFGGSSFYTQLLIKIPLGNVGNLETIFTSNNFNLVIGIDTLF
ncbi:hypothetical protein IB67_05305 [Fervidobacterium riparium]|uniref:Uncharacterized protein n=1 Tax=Fervidobacterium gondwanense DSM 13020 TaxID=1121883 RepID=A0A1M7S889_FERGO|nr:hypothetical protein IB67_05305 [Fervidobacterium riparium]SHN54837.1 hypothetical protein SAMN02745226_00662 [Fervidobacterium gondwanense DSM 13020]